MASSHQRAEDGLQTRGALQLLSLLRSNMKHKYQPCGTILQQRHFRTMQDTEHEANASGLRHARQELGQHQRHALGRCWCPLLYSRLAGRLGKSIKSFCFQDCSQTFWMGCTIKPPQEIFSGFSVHGEEGRSYTAIIRILHATKFV